MHKRIIINVVSCILSAVVLCSALGISHVTHCCMSCEDSGWEVLTDEGCHGEPADDKCCASASHLPDKIESFCHADSPENTCSFSVVTADIDFMNHKYEMPSCNLSAVVVAILQLPFVPDQEILPQTTCSDSPPLSGRQLLSLHTILLI